MVEVHCTHPWLHLSLPSSPEAAIILVIILRLYFLDFCDLMNLF